MDAMPGMNMPTPRQKTDAEEPAIGIHGMLTSGTGIRRPGVLALRQGAGTVSGSCDHAAS